MMALVSLCSSSSAMLRTSSARKRQYCGSLRSVAILCARAQCRLTYRRKRRLEYSLKTGWTAFHPQRTCPATSGVCPQCLCPVAVACVPQHNGSAVFCKRRAMNDDRAKSKSASGAVAVGLATISIVLVLVVFVAETASTGPMHFIETHLGFSPDGGDGSMELLVAPWEGCGWGRSD